MKSLTQMFEEIYQTGLWVKNHTNPPSLSGPGSFPERSKPYLEFLKNFLVKNNIKSVTDYGCGDNAIYRDFDWGDVVYTGVDVSKTAIGLAQKNNPGGTFICAETMNIPIADLLICKDVLGHWSGHNSTTDLGDRRHMITEWLSINYNKFFNIIIVDAHEGMIENYFPQNAKFNVQVLKFYNKFKKLYTKESNSIN